MNKDQNCIFCKIVAKEIPAEIVYEDKDFLAFMDIKPRSPGHVLVIPTNHYNWFWDAENIGDYIKVVQKIARAQRKAFGHEIIEGKIEGREVAHAHFWVFPDSDNVTDDKKDLKGNAEKIRRNL